MMNDEWRVGFNQYTNIDGVRMNGSSNNLHIFATCCLTLEIEIGRVCGPYPAAALRCMNLISNNIYKCETLSVYLPFRLHRFSFIVFSNFQWEMKTLRSHSLSLLLSRSLDFDVIHIRCFKQSYDVLLFVF